MPYIEVIEYDKAEEELKDVYDNLIETRGKLANVHKIQSLNPESIVKHMELYLTIMFGKSPLRRVQREMMAVVVSKANDCEYCQLHHAEAVQHYWKDEAKVKQLRIDYSKLHLSDIDAALCNFAHQLTVQPNSNNKALTEQLKELGVEDRTILDATLVIAYFNFVNRMVLGLGVHVNESELSGYNYE